MSSLATSHPAREIEPSFESRPRNTSPKYCRREGPTAILRREGRALPPASRRWSCRQRTRRRRGGRVRCSRWCWWMTSRGWSRSSCRVRSSSSSCCPRVACIDVFIHRGGDAEAVGRCWVAIGSELACLPACLQGVTPWRLVYPGLCPCRAWRACTWPARLACRGSSWQWCRAWEG